MSYTEEEIREEELETTEEPEEIEEETEESEEETKAAGIAKFVSKAVPVVSGMIAGGAIGVAVERGRQRAEAVREAEGVTKKPGLFKRIGNGFKGFKEGFNANQTAEPAEKDNTEK